ncbi:hypothetical protein BBO99_00007609 [Phytophthora kernoviae]|uniref:5'-3' exonuclease domain-containing protein n=2 Tax=Phytophthora kernoviae TaxID=325452 RepID=A0A3R7JWF6_9STRA|nr:hypothetical protein G195_008663 [Phytophthora kernoviae 00238/432]KAG2517145.1 hypothetical protein JM16_007511 [Phytophthora kernoviae]KAG2519732.1 hypothetical protein JM18_007202 [Phytophthora kernoviae]RLN31416.1 hypothetical protein BBI17_007515 [Phytophthora kernoviae]RLN76351.1 hypothetical protein BBO99_00007609 [Phytophthora kernoviae]
MKSVVACATAAAARAKRSFSMAAAMAEGAEVPIRRRKSLLVDGNNALYHFFDPLSTVETDGIQTSAVDGLLRLLRRMDESHKPEHISVVFDSKERPTTRRIMQPTYKADRNPTPKSLTPQFAYARKVLQEVNVNCIDRPGFEADDIIASYATQYAAAGFDVLLISNDNDFLQLVHNASADEDTETDKSDGVCLHPLGTVELYQPSKRRYIRERNVRGRFGLHPNMLPDFHALCGHQWKKIPRVESLTDEVAVELLTNYSGLFPLLRQLDTLEDPNLSKTLKQSIGTIESSYRMVKLDSSLALPVAIVELQRPQLS